MAVQRNTERLNLPAQGGTGQVNTQGPGIVGPTPTRGIFDTQTAGVPQQPATVQHSMDPVVTALFGMGTALIDTKMKVDQEQAYLDGALAVGAGLSEAQLEGSVLTSAWRTAGFRDTVGRLALADYDTKVATDMKKLREQSPEEMASYLKAQRAELMPTFQGMSAQARGTIFNQLLTAERSALAQHTKAHTEFIVDTQSKVLQVGAANKLDMLTQSQGNPDINIPALDATVSYVKSNILENPNLPLEVKHKLFSEVMQNALQQGNVNLFQKFDELAMFPGPDGQMTTAMNLLPMKMQTDLAEKYRSAAKDNDFRINANWHSDYNSIKVNMVTGGPVPTFEEFESVARAGVNNKTFTPEKYSSELVNYAKFMKDRQDQGDIAHAVITGDMEKIARSGMTGKEAAKTTFQSLLKTLDLPQATHKALEIANNKGNQEMYKIVGENLQTAISAAINNTGKPVDPSTSQMLGTVFGMLDQASAQGNSSATSSILSVLPDTQQSFVLRVQESVRQGQSLDIAMASARTAQLEDEKTPAALRASRRAEVNAGMSATVEEIKERQLGDTATTYVKAMFSNSAAGLMGLQPFRAWFDDPTAVDNRIHRTETAVAEEYERAAMMNPSMSKDHWRELAISKVNQRIVPTKNDAVILPYGTDINAYFGVSQSASSERIGWALDEVYEPQTQGGKVSFVARDGKLWAEEITGTGKRVTPVLVEPKQVGQLVEERRKKDAEQANKEVGMGVTRKGADGTEVTFTGRNNVGISPELAYKIRDKLVTFEGVQSKPYADGSGGRTSAGVGVNSVNPHYYPQVGLDGRVAKEQIDASFNAASNGAMKAANTAAIRWGLTSDDAVEFLSVLAYQGGEGFYAAPKLRYPAMLDGIATKNTEQALAELYRTPAYKSAHPERQQYYERKVRQLSK